MESCVVTTIIRTIEKYIEIPLKDYKIHGDVWISQYKEPLIVPFTEGRISDGSITYF